MAVLTEPPVGHWLSTDDEAFDSIYRTYRSALLAFCRSRLGDGAEAEDACQETFLRAYRALPRFDRTQRLWPWLATIAANVCSDMRRRRRPIPVSACDDLPREMTVDPEDELDARARRQLVGAALRELPASYRRQVYLADAEGWSYDDIASEEQRSLASVRSSLMRGRIAFKAHARAIAEERGLWPLSAVLPFAGVRGRLLAWRSSRHVDQVSTAAMPSAVTLAQAAAAAAIALLGSVAPVGVAVAGAEDGVTRTSSSRPAVADATGHPAAARAEPQAQEAAPAPPMSPPKATTNVDLGGDERGVNTKVGVGDEPEPDPTAWWFTRFHCRESTVLGETCALLDKPPSP